MAEHASVIRVSHFEPSPGKGDDLKARLDEGLAELRASRDVSARRSAPCARSQMSLPWSPGWASGAAHRALSTTAQSQRRRVVPISSLRRPR